MYSWSASPALQIVYESLDKQRQIIDHLKTYLQERLVPFQCHLAEHQRNIDQALRHMQSRLVPLRQYIQGGHENHVSAEAIFWSFVSLMACGAPFF